MKDFLDKLRLQIVVREARLGGQKLVFSEKAKNEKK